jgi:hypothetical protein
MGMHAAGKRTRGKEQGRENKRTETGIHKRTLQDKNTMVECAKRQQEVGAMDTAGIGCQQVRYDVGLVKVKRRNSGYSWCAAQGHGTGQRWTRETIGGVH